ncbi:S9 family peptidase [Dactylosporangium salmoneum]|uniref:Peptidase S9 prolyl oligopeptidase catalytic domain-containing protein n=1 Tax=Dactylosporangium salmoneum TaxID=53361 RepID=A0ABN3GEQ9_9ACTN
MTRSLSPEDLYDLRLPADPQLSPDGERVAYVLSGADRAGDRTTGEVWEVRVTGGAPRRLTNGPADAAPRWSPDGGTLVFLRDGQLHALPAAGGEPTRLTDTAARLGGARSPVWSPDGTRIAFVGPAGGSDDSAPIVVDRLRHKIDGVGRIGAAWFQLFVVDVATGEVMQVTDGDFHVAFPVWSPDSACLAFAAAVGERADLSTANGVYVVDVAAAQWPAEPRLVGSATGIAMPCAWYADGSALLTVGRGTADIGILRLMRQPLSGGPAEELCADLDRNVMYGMPGYPGGVPQFAGDDVLFVGRDRGASRLYRRRDGGVEQVTEAAAYGISGLSVAPAAGRAAAVVADRTRFGEIAVIEWATGRTAVEVTVLTHHQAQSLPDVELIGFTERDFTISDGTLMHGLLIRDPDAPRGGPLLLDVHGGPHNAWAPLADSIHVYHQALASEGWTILALNVRGSDGYGEAFYQAVVGGWGEHDEKDFLEPVAALVAEGLVDGDRIALTGYSYGGYMSCWLSARTGIFRAVAAGGVVTDLLSLSGTSDEGEALGTLEVGGGRDRLVQLSPLTHVDAVRVPTLILHGEADDTCPVGQAEQWFHALRSRGVRTQLVLYPGGSHLFVLNGRPSHRVDYNQRVADWVTRHLGEHPDHLAGRTENGTGAVRP